jgi:uncharacterized protein (TIGR02145 family)
MKTTAVLLMALCVSAAAQTADTFTDPRDGKTYRTVKIGTQVWMAENLNYQTNKSLYLNYETDASWCYDNEASNCAEYGKLYTWNMAISACPAGWHLPTYEEWRKLVTLVSGEDSASAKLKSKPPNWNGTDESKFSALPGGYRATDGSFFNLGSRGYWWTAAEYYASYAHYRSMDSFYAHVGEFKFSKGSGFSVRCLRD